MSIKLLYADDSVTMQKVIQLVLENEGIDLSVAGNGFDAMEKLKTSRPDIVIADISMPDMNGFELCERIKSEKETKDIPVILISGELEKYDPRQGDQAGADGHITKPFKSDEFIVKVRTFAKAGKVAASGSEEDGESYDIGKGGPVESGETAGKVLTLTAANLASNEASGNGGDEELEVIDFDSGLDDLDDDLDDIMEGNSESPELDQADEEDDGFGVTEEPDGNDVELPYTAEEKGVPQELDTRDIFVASLAPEDDTTDIFSTKGVSGGDDPLGNNPLINPVSDRHSLKGKQPLDIDDATVELGAVEGGGDEFEGGDASDISIGEEVDFDTLVEEERLDHGEIFSIGAGTEEVRSDEEEGIDYDSLLKAAETSEETLDAISSTDDSSDGVDFESLLKAAEEVSAGSGDEGQLPESRHDTHEGGEGEPDFESIPGAAGFEDAEGDSADLLPDLTDDSADIDAMWNDALKTAGIDDVAPVSESGYETGSGSETRDIDTLWEYLEKEKAEAEDAPGLPAPEPELTAEQSKAALESAVGKVLYGGEHDRIIKEAVREAVDQAIKNVIEKQVEESIKMELSKMVGESFKTAMPELIGMVEKITTQITPKIAEQMIRSAIEQIKKDE